MGRRKEEGTKDVQKVVRYPQEKMWQNLSSTSIMDCVFRAVAVFKR